VKSSLDDELPQPGQAAEISMTRIRSAEAQPRCGRRSVARRCELEADVLRFSSPTARAQARGEQKPALTRSASQQQRQGASLAISGLIRSAAGPLHRGGAEDPRQEVGQHIVELIVTITSSPRGRLQHADQPADHRAADERAEHADHGVDDRRQADPKPR